MAALDDLYTWLDSLDDIEVLHRQDTSAYCALFTLKFTPQHSVLMRFYRYDPHRNFLFKEDIAYRDIRGEWIQFKEALRNKCDNLGISYVIESEPGKYKSYSGYSYPSMYLLRREPIVMLSACDNGSYFQ